MLFYILMFTIMGGLAANAYHTNKYVKVSPGGYPLWVVQNNGYSKSAYILSGLAVLVAPFYTIINWGFLWVFATILELAIGAFIVGFFSLGTRNFFYSMTPIFMVLMLGSMFGFWYL